MFKKGRKREAKGLAVVYFIIGLVILLIILAVIYFALVELDYSDRMRDPNATMRAYVEMTPDPDSFDAIEDEEGLLEDDGPELEVDLTTQEPTPTPTPSPTPSPTPEPTPEPTPTATPIPPMMLAQPRTAGFTLPKAAPASCQAAITKCSVSVGDNNRYIYLAGYAFLNETAFDASLMRTYLVVSQPKTNQLIVYPCTMKAGISGDSHAGAVCKNPASGDFDVCFDVSQLYTGDIYNLGLVVGYKPNAKRRKATYVYYAFPSDVNFTVLDGQVVEPVRVSAIDGASLAVGAVDVGALPGLGGVSDDTAVEDDGFDDSEPADLEPAPTPASPFITQSPFVTQTPADIQQQIMANQMGVG